MKINSIRGKLKGLVKNPSGEEEYDSLMERDYMIELEHDPLVEKWTKKHNIKIPYDFFVLKRNYLPDFLVEYKDGTKEIHETKGLPLLFLLSTKAKRQTAEEYCAKLGWKYKLVTR